MAKEGSNNSNNADNTLEDKLNKVEVLSEKLSKTNTAFGARFQQLMEFSTSISTTEQELKNQANLHKKELEKIDKRIKTSEEVIGNLSTKIQELEKAISKYKEIVDEYIKRTDSPLGIVSNEQVQLSHKFNLLQSLVEKEHKLQKTMIWSYRVALIAISIFFVYYHFSITTDINSINNTLNNLSEQIIENKPQPNSINSLPANNKPNPSKK
jgi:hypothetical protein